MVSNMILLSNQVISTKVQPSEEILIKRSKVREPPVHVKQHLLNIPHFSPLDQKIFCTLNSQSVTDFDVFKLKSGSGVTVVAHNPDEYLWNPNINIMDCHPSTYTRRGKTEIVKRYDLSNGHYKIVPKRFKGASSEPKVKEFDSLFLHIIPAK